MDRLGGFFAFDGSGGNDVAVLEPSAGEGRSTTYRQFHDRLRVLAAFLSRVCKTDERIAIFLPRGVNAYASEMGALFSGRLFCPIDITHPPDRVAHYLGDLNPKVILTDASGMERLGKVPFETVDVEELDGAPSTSPGYGDSAYVIFTSGSTGLPKGVKVSRRSISRFLDWSISYYGVGAGDRWAQFSSLGFDLSLVDLLTCLLSGATLVPVARSIDRTLPARFVSELEISVWHSVPSLIPLLMREAKAAEQLRSLRVATFCGEPLMPQQALSLLDAVPHLRLVNTYGPTEGTFFCTSQAVDTELCVATTDGSLPIGEAIPGWGFEFADCGSEGLNELVLSSDYLADGYISPTPDQERFGVNPSTGTPYYRTGDLVRRDGDQVFYAERLDNQVKISGNRLDLTEVEYHALAFGASEAKAFVLDNKVAAAVVLPEGLTGAGLTNYLSGKLPTFAVPKEVLIRETLPRNANAKIDTQALRAELAETWRKRG